MTIVKKVTVRGQPVETSLHHQAKRVQRECLPNTCRAAGAGTANQGSRKFVRLRCTVLRMRSMLSQLSPRGSPLRWILNLIGAMHRQRKPPQPKLEAFSHIKVLRLGCALKPLGIIMRGSLMDCLVLRCHLKSQLIISVTNPKHVVEEGSRLLPHWSVVAISSAGKILPEKIVRATSQAMQ